jgi:hypothetical protein
MDIEMKVFYGFLGVLAVIIAASTLSHVIENSAASQPVLVHSNSEPPVDQSHNRSHEWYIADQNFTSCIKTDSPAKKIEFLRMGGGEASANESRDNTGNLVSVEVSAPSTDGLQSTVWTYYASLGACKAELRYRNYIPEEYR